MAFDDARRAEAQAMPMPDVVERLGLSGLTRAGHELVGPCPRCGGTDRFGINLRKGVFGCRRCGGKGGGIDLVMFVMECSFPAALEFLCGAAHEVSPEERARRAAIAEENRLSNEARAAKERAEARALAARLWRDALSPEGTPVRAYLERRGITQALLPRLPACLRYCPDLRFTVRLDREWRVVHSGPAMLAAVQGADGRLSAVHRTWIDLTHPRGKAVLRHPVTGEALPSKKVLGSKKGGAIRLSGPQREAPVMVMGEGIETTLSAMVAGVHADAVFWAGVDMGNMAGRLERGAGLKFAGRPDLEDDDAFLPPQWVRRLIYVQDGDSDARDTRSKMEAGVRRAMVRRPGLQGQIAAAPVGMDLNDVLLAGGGTE